MALVDPLEPAVPADPVTAKPAATAKADELEARIAYSFRNRDLLAAALTHVSAASVRKRTASYQRLEFLGDRVLGLAISDLLYARFPSAEEGELSRRLSDLVRKETCADVARAWSVGDALKLGAGEARSGGRDNVAILGDVCEAIIGAVFLDGGFQPAAALVRRAFSFRVDETAEPTRDPKTALQEWAQALGRKPPVYREISRQGPDHRPDFVIGVEVDGFAPCEASGASKRTAEQAAARAFLAREAVPVPQAQP